MDETGFGASKNGRLKSVIVPTSFKGKPVREEN
jgi:hypothetical protein